MKGKDPTDQNNPLPTCNPDAGERRGHGTQLVLLLPYQAWKSRKGDGAHIKVSFATHALGYSFGAAGSSCISTRVPCTNSFRLRGAGAQGLTCNFEIHEKLLWFHHHSAGMMSSNRGQNSPPCTNTHWGTTETKTKSSSSCLKTCQAYKVLLLPSWLSRKLIITLE